MKKEALRMDHVTVSAGTDILLNNLTFSLYTDCINGLVAKDDKGLDCLKDRICFNHPIDAGTVWFDGKIVNRYSYSDNTANKISVIEHESHLAEALSVADNIFVLRGGFRQYFLKERVLNGQAERIAAECGINLDIMKPVSLLSPLERCEVELIKAKVNGSRIIIADNPSNFLSQHELPVFQKLLLDFCNEDTAIFYMGNHHEELFRIADRTALFSDSHIVKVFVQNEMTNEKMAPYITDFRVRNTPSYSSEEGMMHFHHVYTETLNGLEFVLHRGECLTLLDMDNRIFGDLKDLLTGRYTCRSGKITVDHEDIAEFPKNAYLKKGLAVIPSDAANTLVYNEMNYMDNLTFLLDVKLRTSLIRRNILRSIRKEYMPLLGPVIDTENVCDLDIRDRLTMVYMRYRLLKPKVLVCFKPLARGDAYCRLRVLEMLKEIREAGTSVLILTANISDTLEISDRLITIENGRNTSEYKQEEFAGISR